MELTQTSSTEPRAYRRFTPAERSAHLSAWSQSGQSAQSYAHTHGIRPGNLYRWSHAAKSQDSLSSGATFLPVRVGIASPREEFEVSLRENGFECSVRSKGANRAELVSLVKSLKQEVFDV